MNFTSETHSQWSWRALLWLNVNNFEGTILISIEKIHKTRLWKSTQSWLCGGEKKHQKIVTQNIGFWVSQIHLPDQGEPQIVFWLILCCWSLSCFLKKKLQNIRTRLGGSSTENLLNLSAKIWLKQTGEIASMSVTIPLPPMNFCTKSWKESYKGVCCGFFFFCDLARKKIYGWYDESEEIFPFRGKQ